LFVHRAFIHSWCDSVFERQANSLPVWDSAIVFEKCILITMKSETVGRESHLSMPTYQNSH